MAASESEDEMKLLQIFPNELWNMILENVKESPDYHKISNASSHFRTRLLPRAPEILFPEVFSTPLIDDYCPEYETWVILRQVCHTWKKVVDQDWQTLDFRCGDGSQADFCEMPQLNYDDRMSQKFDWAGDFASFEAHFDPTHYLSTTQVNPFFNRTVILTFLDPQPAPEDFTACLRFLRKYGHHVWYSIIYESIDGDRATQLRFYRHILPQILELMPNLKALDITGGALGENPDFEDMSPFPTLPQLDYVYSVVYGFGPVVQALLRKNPQVTHFHMSGYSGRVLKSYLELLPNLKVTAIDFKMLDQGIFLTTNGITRLWLTCGKNKRWNSIFRALETQFSGTLTELHVNLPFVQEMDVVPSLRLPHLKILHLTLVGAEPLDFLLPMRQTLEELCLIFDTISETEGGGEQCPSFRWAMEQEARGRVKLYRHWKELDKSNIWPLFPKLELLETKMYKRGYGRDRCWTRYSCTRKYWAGKTAE